MESRAVYTIGYGKRELPELIGTLKEHGIQYVVDVRSVPYSKFKPEFSRESLQRALQREGIGYVFMGDLLGGRPDDSSCYVRGKVSYNRVKETKPFWCGINRLRRAWEKKLRVCLLCSEGDPKNCHRSKLIGQVLEEGEDEEKEKKEEKIPVRHIDQHGKVLEHREVIRKVTKGQLPLLPSFGSRKKYRVGS